MGVIATAMTPAYAKFGRLGIVIIALHVAIQKTQISVPSNAPMANLGGARNKRWRNKPSTC